MTDARRWLDLASRRLAYARPDPGLDEEITAPEPEAARTFSLVLPLTAAPEEARPQQRIAVPISGPGGSRSALSRFVPRRDRRPFPGRPRALVSRYASGVRPYRRAEVRRPVHVGIALLRPGALDPDFALGADLSPVGARVLSDALLMPFDRLRVTFRLPWSPVEYSFTCEVVRVRPAPLDEYGARYAVGVQFLDVAPADRIRLAHALRGIPPALPQLRRAG